MNEFLTAQKLVEDYRAALRRYDALLKLPVKERMSSMEFRTLDDTLHGYKMAAFDKLAALVDALVTAQN